MRLTTVSFLTTKKQNPNLGREFYYMISSRSGQSCGIFLPHWAPLVPASLTTGSGGLLFLMGKLAMTSDSIKRIVISSGGAIDSYERHSIRYTGEKVRDVYLPEWFLLDVTFAFEPEETPRTITLLNTSWLNNDEFVTDERVYIGRTRAKNISWKDFSLLAGRFHLEELWHRITGVVKPSWGGIRAGAPAQAGSAGNNIYIADCNMHIGVINDSWNFPLGADMADLGRLETFIQNAGISLTQKERPIEEVARTLRTLDCGSDLWMAAVQKIIGEEKERALSGEFLQGGRELAV